MTEAEAIWWSKCRAFMASYAFDRVIKVGQKDDGYKKLVAELKKKPMKCDS
jgi:hypothetical protein